jgi:hypothetical protein
MNTKALMWVILGLILIFGGLMSSVTESRKLKSREPRPQTIAETAVPSEAVTAPSKKEFNTGFSIDPIKGLKRKDENAEYFR